jgi:hypothetical protein
MTGTNCDLFTHKSVPVIFESPCIILIAFPQQQYFRERASVLLYKYIACVVKHMLIIRNYNDLSMLKAYLHVYCTVFCLKD